MQSFSAMLLGLVALKVVQGLLEDPEKPVAVQLVDLCMVGEDPKNPVALKLVDYQHYFLCSIQFWG